MDVALMAEFLLSSLCAEVRPAPVRSPQSGVELSFRQVGVLLLLVKVVYSGGFGQQVWWWFWAPLTLSALVITFGGRFLPLASTSGRGWLGLTARRVSGVLCGSGGWSG
ncbi:hypothetical protein RHMOL_Rhmol04G0146200 [Rhododendron molle]|uniref:Uncharacterized protein n=1 Tax=Rhododendron molle TaxID=49168 RepID=A0ACC0P0A6_RHOML|nr:hypothetical protein RHMOL_Rhmol04G0146200 [Rhododendron molle]